LNLLVFIKISSIIKPEKILLLKPVILREDYPWISARGNERFDRRDAGVDFFEDKRALLIEIRVNGLALLFRAAAIPVSIEGFEDQLQLDDLFVCVRTRAGPIFGQTNWFHSSRFE
ncbi:hypothetical protein SAMN05216328_1761, partial [Ensifer sp. YR511]